MSEATRAVALTEAVKVASAAQTFDDVLTLAEQYHQFLVSDAAVPAGTTSDVQKPTTKLAATKPATKLAAIKPAPKTEEQVVADAAEAGAGDEGPTEEKVGKAIADLLAANKRKEAVALLKKFGATSKSTLKPEHYADFLEEAALI